MALVAEKIFILALLLIVMAHSATWAIRSSISLSRLAGLSEFTISVLVVTFISILPETVISLFSALEGTPSLALGALIGSNVADLTLVFGAVALFTGGIARAERKFIKKDYVFLAFLFLPLILGFTGHYSRLDGLLLILGSVVFFFVMAKAKRRARHHIGNGLHEMPFAAVKSLLLLAGGLLSVGAAAYYTVRYASDIAGAMGVTPALVGLLIVAPGACLPELIFSLRAVRKGHAMLAFGDVLGTVITDATLILGMVALISPFSFNPRLIIVTGIFMLFAGLLFFHLLRSDRRITRAEGAALLLFYAVFIIVEIALRNWTPLITR